MMFGYFFILSTICMILSGVFDKFRINKYICVICLAVIFLLSTLDEITLEYKFILNLGWCAIVLLSIGMNMIFNRDYVETTFFSFAIAIIMWALAKFIGIFDFWALKALTIILISVLLTQEQIKASYLSVFSYTFSGIINTVFTQDIELAVFIFGVGQDFGAIVMCFLLPIIILNFKWKAPKFISLRRNHGTT